MSTKSSVTPPGPIPAGLVPLVDCAAALAAGMGHGDLSRPVEIWRHNETGELRIEPDPQQLHKLLEVYRGIVLDALRMGRLTALLLPEAAQALPASFWTWPDAKGVIATGVWQDRPLAVDADEIRLVAAALHHVTNQQQSDADTSETNRAHDKMGEEPRVERRGRRPDKRWPDILCEVTARVEADGFPENQAKLELWIMEEAEAVGFEPSASTVRRHASKLLRRLERQVNAEDD